ncbi:hypothetical protein A2886_03055 [candidate division WWE3 bacterium RIFCSPHIGHO2_01_FULL_42_13]|uniref:Methyltransferase domain-containing protein n=1 Tax=candidate division WWE3 bacterium RIFCSPHIGHO2_01_FULL_42_13 TaxID=1802617 RepID=A0A1F4UPZ2_UNCKA|nr:MAG: hypothetical protein A2886_03055 [candidate division WWE3 bacterium RIFCSPHIGHO2_01_FULL_42_13]HLB66331.1 methyltransferase domain-containing protein [Candidatus Saccharimonadales bacterium]
MADQYLKLLNSLDLSEVGSVLDCGFGDGYFLKFYQQHFPHLEIFGVDISKAAKSKVNFLDKSRLYTSDLATFSPKRKFGIVHSFDVVYHILKSEDYVKSLSNLASLSDKYVILHERFFQKPPLVSSKHVKMRRSEFTNQILNSKGFFLTGEIPTHFIAARLLTYRLNKFIPGFLYKVDRYISEKVHPSAQEFLASHYIRVYSRSE